MTTTKIAWLYFLIFALSITVVLLASALVESKKDVKTLMHLAEPLTPTKP